MRGAPEQDARFTISNIEFWTSRLEFKRKGSILSFSYTFIPASRRKYTFEKGGIQNSEKD